MISSPETVAPTSDVALNTNNRPPDPERDKSSGTGLLFSHSVHMPELSSPSGVGTCFSLGANSLKSYKSALSAVNDYQASSRKDWICVGEHDIVPSIENGIRTLQISKPFEEKLCKPWSNTIVARLIGKSIGYAYLCHRLHTLWKPSGDMQIIDLDEDCFLVKFGVEQDYFHALTGGPWLIIKHYLVVQQWDLTSRVSDKLPARMVVWVRLPQFPIVFYHPQILTALGNLIGKTVQIDFPTQNANRGKFARLAVEINFEEPLTPIILKDGASQLVEYENIPCFFFYCGKVGHDSGVCPRKMTPTLQLVENEVMPAVNVQASAVVAVACEGVADEFRPWMVVSRKHRWQRREATPIKESGQIGKVVGVTSNWGRS
ncbi:hypothetical protein LINPERHAP2_LOCUS4881 [Linum perenne]